MRPILYPASEGAFLTNGMGGLPDVVSCTVEEEINGIYELTMEYLVNGTHAGDLVEGNIIMASHDTTGDLQPFRICKRTDGLGGTFTVNARHLSYDLGRIPVLPFRSISPYIALQKLKENAVVSCPFNFDVDFSLPYGYAFWWPKSAREMLLAVSTDTQQDYSMADIWKCEFLFDRWTVYVVQRRGEDKDISIRYGVNMTGLEVVSENRRGFYAVVPFCRREIDGATAIDAIVCDPPVVMLPDAVDDLGGAMTLDLTDEFEEEPTPAELETAAFNWLEKNQPWVTEKSITISFIDLGETEDYKDLLQVQELVLGDSVTVYHPKHSAGILGHGTKFRLVRTVYDVLRERYIETTLGRQPETLSAIVANMNRRLQGVSKNKSLAPALEE